MYHIIVNGAVRKKSTERKLKAVESVFESAGKDYVLHRTKGRGHAKKLAENLTSDGSSNTVVAMGGDGTLHEILNGFKDFERNSLALIPLGTGNDFAESAKIPTDVKRAAEIIVNGEASYVDYIELSSGLRSINAVGMGIDVDVLKRAYAGRGRGKSKYLRALIVSLAKFKSIRYKIVYNGITEEKYGLIAAIGNGKQIGGGIKLFPDADVADGKLNLLLVDYLSKRATVGAFIKLMLGKVNKIKQVTAVTCKEAAIIPQTDSFTIQAEGELYKNIPIEAKIVEKRLKFYLP